MRDAYINTLYQLTERDNSVFSFVADNGAIVFDRYRRSFPNNFVNFGIAESTMVSVSAGVSSCKKIPFIYTIIPFLVMRAFEQIRNDICMQKMNVKIVGIGAGVSYSTLGPTHHAIEDLALMRVLPNMKIFSPADALETKKATEAAYSIEGPVYIRLGTSKEPAVYNTDYDFQIGKGILLKDGKDVTLIATGNSVHDAKLASDILARDSISVRLINIHTIKPFDNEIVIKAAEETKAIVTIEGHSVIGGLGSAVADTLAEYKNSVRFKKIGFNDCYCSEYGSFEEMKESCGISVRNIVETVKQILEKK
ncbi:MAG: transketolase [Candidatus Riflebacteria bacterium]|nr:transketolase [Candidatus Riflebacteria bacterium]